MPKIRRDSDYRLTMRGENNDSTRIIKHNKNHLDNGY